MSLPPGNLGTTKLFGVSRLAFFYSVVVVWAPARQLLLHPTGSSFLLPTSCFLFSGWASFKFSPNAIGVVVVGCPQRGEGKSKKNEAFLRIEFSGITFAFQKRKKRKPSPSSSSSPSSSTPSTLLVVLVGQCFLFRPVQMRLSDSHPIYCLAAFPLIFSIFFFLGVSSCSLKKQKKRKKKKIHAFFIRFQTIDFDWLFLSSETRQYSRRKITTPIFYIFFDSTFFKHFAFKIILNILRLRIRGEFWSRILLPSVFYHSQPPRWRGTVMLKFLKSNKDDPGTPSKDGKQNGNCKPFFHYFVL